ncbi:LCP family protein [Phycicoccus sp. CSK15P-2]|uniref:LCP family protein n=1 Tax=Phycicoccus sp. CSK15P-2 TaxID=2807627 RepID=UPI0027DD965E|nr:LCP family protein [Phycicoccus sp. CSK15P-2]
MPKETRRNRARERSRETHPLRLRRVLTVLVVLGVVLGGGLGFAWWRLEGNIDRVSLGDALGEEDRPQKAEGPLNILLVGSDTREGQDLPGDTLTSGARSDTTLLAHLSADRERVTVVSIPRDSMVPMPPSCDLDTTKDLWRVQQVNSAFSMGGPACLVATLEADTGLFVDHVAIVDFSGFREMVDALGGVPVCTPVDIDDPKARLRLSAGRHTLDGTQALGWVRARYTLGDGSDLGRIERQQQFLASVVQEATRTSLLLRPDRLFGFLDAATQSLTTDEDLGLGQMKDIAQSVKDVGVDNVALVTVPVETYPADPNRVQWSAAAETLWQTLREDRSVTESEDAGEPTPQPSPTPLTVSPDDITVTVVNATGVDGLAAAAARALRVQGFARVTTSSVADRPDGVVVAHGPGAEEEARTVAAAFPDSGVEEDPTLGDHIRVTIGAGAASVVEVPNRLGSEPLPRSRVSAPPPSTTIKARTADEDICS